MKRVHRVFAVGAVMFICLCTALYPLLGSPEEGAEEKSQVTWLSCRAAGPDTFYNPDGGYIEGTEKLAFDFVSVYVIDSEKKTLRRYVEDERTLEEVWRRDDGRYFTYWCRKIYNNQYKGTDFDNISVTSYCGGDADPSWETGSDRWRRNDLSVQESIRIDRRTLQFTYRGDVYKRDFKHPVQKRYQAGGCSIIEAKPLGADPRNKF
jgi:hypothetical protein